MKYRIFLLLFFLVSSTCLIGQVAIKAEVDHSPALESDDPYEAEIRLDWPSGNVQSWMDRFSPALEAYPVDVKIPLKGTSEKSSNTSILVVFPDVADYAFHFDSLSSVKGLQIKNSDTGEEVHHEDPRTGKKAYVTEFMQGKRFILTFPASGSVFGILKRIYVRETALSGSRDLGFQGSLDCEENLGCVDAPEWQLAAKGVVRMRMVMEEGIGWCTGTLMNNTAKDARPFILSAHHCQSSFTPLYENWRFDFGYRGNSCMDPAAEPAFESMTGCVLRAKGQDSDFLLLELIDTIPVEYDVYWNGWDRRGNYEPDTVALIHHPSADIAKISVDYDRTRIFNFNIFWDEGISTPAKFHLKSFFDLGTHEGGSSGGPLIDTRGFVVGQLHGGRADCDENFAYSGRVHKSWESGSLEHEILGYWLDPLQTGQDTLHGMLHPALGNTYTIRGRVKDPKGNPVSNILIKVEGTMSKEIYTDSSGQFTLPVVSREGTITLKPRKNTKVANGVTAIDLLLIQKHLLNIQPFTESHQLIAADVSGNEQITGTDLLLIQKLLLGINSSFPGRQSWTFDPVAIPLEDIAEPAVELEIMAIKLGDVNATADVNE